MESKCLECENDAILEVAELRAELDYSREWAALADKAREVITKLYELTHDRLEETERKVDVYKEHIKNVRSQDDVC